MDKGINSSEGLSLAPIVCSELWPVHSNTKIDKSLRLQVGVPGWLRTGHSSEHIIIGVRDTASSLAVTKWEDNGVRLRVYYQAPDLSLKEHYWDHYPWYTGW